MQKIDKAQTTVLNLIFNSLHFDEWYMQGKFIGFKLKDDYGQEVRYTLNPKHWNTNRPPALDWQTYGPTPESQIRQMIHNHFDSIQKLITKNDWLYSSYSLEHPDGLLLSFSITGINSHSIICPYKLGDDNAISCCQLLELHKRKFVEKMVKKVNSYLKAKLGLEVYRSFRGIPREERTRHYLRSLQKHIG